MFNHYFILSFCILIVCCQNHKNNIAITITDSNTKQVLGFASINILEEGYSVKDTISDVDGHYNLVYTEPNQLFLIISYVGYYPKSFTLDNLKTNNEVSLNRIRSENQIILDNVCVNPVVTPPKNRTV